MFRSPTNKVLRVRFVRDVASENCHYRAGSIVELPFDLAKGLTKAGSCEPSTAQLFTPEPDVDAFGCDPRHNVRAFNRERLEQHRDMRLPAE